MALPAPAPVAAARQRALLAAAIVVLLAGGALAYAVAPRAAAPPQPRAPISPSIVRQLSLEAGGVARPLSPGEAIEIGTDLVATVTLIGGGEDGHDLLLMRLRDASGGPVSGAALHALVEMRYMEHGRLEAVGMPTAPGSYTVPIVLAMPGEWRIDLSLTSGSTTATLRLDFDEFR